MCPAATSLGRASANPSAVWPAGRFMCPMMIDPGRTVCRERGSGVTVHVEVDRDLPQLADEGDRDVVEVGRAGAEEPRRRPGESGHQLVVGVDLVDRLVDAGGAVDAVRLAAGHRERPVPGAVVGQFEQVLGSEPVEDGTVGMDPAGVEEQGGRDLLGPEQVEQIGVHPFATGTAARVQGQDDRARVAAQDHTVDLQAPGGRRTTLVAPGDGLQICRGEAGRRGCGGSGGARGGSGRARSRAQDRRGGRSR